MKGILRMSNIKEYKKDGKTLYHVKGYLGVDPLTGKQKNFDRRNFKTKKAAESAYNRAKIAFEDGEYRQKTNRYTFAEVYNQWFKVYKNTVKESTYVKTEELFNNHILPAIGEYVLAQIKPYHLQDAVDDWHQRLSKYKVIYNYMKRVFKYALLQEYIKANPTDKVIVPTKKIERETYQREKDFYSKHELEHLMHLLSEHEALKWYAVFRLLAYSGIRRGEVLALTWDDIDFKTNVLDINKTLAQGENNSIIVQSPKSDASLRKIGLDQGTLKILRKWKIEQAELLLGLGFNALQSKQLVFSNEKNNSFLALSAFRNAFERICERHDIEMIHIHGFRHTHASLLFEAGLKMDEVKERLGHEKIETTMNIYTHITPERRDEAGEKFAKFMNI